MFCIYPINAQQIANFTHYATNPNLYNPASVGLDGTGHLQLGYRQQWLNHQTAPKSQIVSIGGRIFKRAGIGLNIVNEQAHIMRHTTLSGQYAFHIIDQGAQRLSLGIYGGVYNHQIDFGDTKIADAADLVLLEGTQNKIQWDAGIGFNYGIRSDKFIGNIGAATTQLPAIIHFLEDESLAYEAKGHYRITANAHFKISNFFQIEPIIHYTDYWQKPTVNKGQLEALLRVHFLNQLCWISGGWRSQNAALNGGFGIKLNRENNLQLSGIYEVSRTYADVFGPTFELSLAMDLGKSKAESSQKTSTSKSPCPQKRKAYWQSEKYLKKELSKNASPELNANIRVTQIGEELKLVYSFDYETEVYDANRQPHIKALLQYIANQMTDLTDDCQTPHFSEITALIIHANHRESEEELKFGASKEYQGDWGTNINAKYILEGNNKEAQIQKGAITNEEMIYLKLWSIQKIMSHNTNVPEDKCTYRISTNNTSLEASMRTVITIKLK